MVNTKIRLIMFFAAKDGEALYSQQKQDWELTVARIVNSLLPNTDRNWRKWRKPLDHSVQFSSMAQSCLTLCNPMNCSKPGLPVYHQLLEFTQTHVHRVGDAIQPSHPLSSPSPPTPIPPRIRVFSNESTLCMRWPKYWSFSFNISPSNEHPGLMSFRMDWLDLLAVQGTLKVWPKSNPLWLYSRSEK